MNSLVLCLLSLALIGLVFGSAWVALRHHRYCRQLKYDPHQNFALGVAHHKVFEVARFHMPTPFGVVANPLK